LGRFKKGVFEKGSGRGKGFRNETQKDKNPLRNEEKTWGGPGQIVPQKKKKHNTNWKGKEGGI